MGGRAGGLAATDLYCPSAKLADLRTHANCWRARTLLLQPPVRGPEKYVYITTRTANPAGNSQRLGQVAH